ncbi:hypothetical protein ISG33_01120 [Glaciecola sp. MH2013]|uniref:alpha-amylase family glycosyl hydrolase n=1 Tax=Glaciecola sp. MH2013 TaxID=2785524 RepID=UPI00189CD5D0|nr:alpha-amylase family glycosyl hydrolase [Glaciecola sp. MH2013]MBF7072000.1 hypothetical protein [Glaciecola sp. MH2013]
MKSINKPFPVILIALLAFAFIAMTPTAFAADTEERVDWGDQSIYFVMIDRFNDGDKSNNDFGLNEYNPSKESHFNGGDIKGLIDKLDYIQGMGFTAVWITPPVLNQWFSPSTNYGGYHGYWAKNFKELDPHFGSLNDYKELADELHKRGMLLIQDIVANHTGIFFSYPNGKYNANNPKQHFELNATLDAQKIDTNELSTFFSPYSRNVQDGNATEFYDAPTQAPFNKIDLYNEEHAQAAIYHWTPEIQNYDQQDQEHRYQLGGLADLNTSNEIVIAELKASYRYWIEEVGVDAFRIDTVKYVEHEFWHRFLHDDDGIFASAAAKGKKDFLAFGEVFRFSEAKQNDGEIAISRFLGSEQKPELNSVINFPLYKDLGRVFAQGVATSELLYRIEQHMSVFPDPRLIPTFLDNHDTPRFLAGANSQALHQALVVLFTLPGIPVIYQGTEQQLRETRQSMFAGGYLSTHSHFDETADFYQLIKNLQGLRKKYKALTHGSFKALKGSDKGTGLMAYKMIHEESALIVLMNTSSKSLFTPAIDLDLSAGTELEPVYSSREEQEIEYHLDVQSEQKGQIQALLGPRAIVIFEQKQADAASHIRARKHPQLLTLKGLDKYDEKTFTTSSLLSGSSNLADGRFALIIDNDWDNRTYINTNTRGEWEFELPVENLGTERHSLSIFDVTHRRIVDTISYTAVMNKAAIVQRQDDPKGDTLGPKMRYLDLQHAASGQQRDIRKVLARASGNKLELSLFMHEVSDNWAPANGFDNVSFSIFIRDNKKKASTLKHRKRALPLINASMPRSSSATDQAEMHGWDIGHVAFGWGNYMFSSKNASPTRRGNNLGTAANITVDKSAASISFHYAGDELGIDDWANVDIYISTWDIAGEGHYRDIAEEASLWTFGGADKDSPKIADDIFISLQAK